MLVSEVTLPPHLCGETRSREDGPTAQAEKEPGAVVHELASQTEDGRTSTPTEASNPMEWSEHLPVKNESTNIGVPGKTPHEQSAGGSEASSGKHLDWPPTKASSFRRSSIRLRPNPTVQKHKTPPPSSGTGPPRGSEDV
ncbi:hypothetical protein HPB52_021661 [Rhipicephalus sanguineus]|uniref:Uncharacterized protein n=1 Tax=Rhipicephalus sanguineus TaxID=34632 RepID=A0A9D4T098_RHISA|nr:hypothetical protein HPB52_021661 [Rhipicephalus sanguineus]